MELGSIKKPKPGSINKGREEERRGRERAREEGRKGGLKEGRRERNELFC